MLKEIAIADAYGAGFEFASPEIIAQHNDLTHYVAHDRYKYVARYTDDTQMSIAIAELILSQTDWTPAAIASKFVECFKRDPRKGYSSGFFSLLESVSSGPELLRLIKPNSERNGAAMRSVHLGVLPTPSAVIAAAQAQAKITHNTEIAIAASCSVALVAHLGLQLKGTLSDIQPLLNKEELSQWNLSWTGNVTTHAYDTVSAALSCLVNHRTLPDLLKACVQLGGDTDSVSAIAVGLATCFDEYSGTFPRQLVDTLDEPTYGLDYLERLDRQLKRSL